ncbi:ricin-type beta-trefoil lectin domain protein [Streptomyces capillispiralis]|uniref:Pretoxin HINT domain-containing protein n=1 Tax=Streptomyces capillispiralis TaxID=68182 RepID=A0A561TFA7_9ACTN|nr:ricin-type beta-trefoil lectin domain protein [Streptomyces capillispiralis]TWF85773.1 pretoxin HINT domain-containing protein [Streptomyces capillispiralis]
MSDVLRLGGPAMTAVARDGLNQPPDKLRELANRDYWEDTPLATAYTKDRDAASQELDALNSRRDAWAVPLDGLETPGGFTVTGFHWPPGSPGDDEEDFYSQTGLTQWVADRFWKSEDDFYEDPTPLADEQTVKAVTDLGTPLYSEKPYDPSLPTDERERQYYEERAFADLTDGFPPASADDARLFLSYGGFPRTAPQPGTAEYRIAVEDLKARFASCAWRDPIDPSEVLGGIAGTAATEWQEEVAAQAGQRDLILDASDDATKALAAGAKSLGEMLGNSWVADHLVQWQDYWSAGGMGWIGDSHVTIEVPGAKGSCLDVAGGKTANGTPVQIYTCNDGASQQWTLEGSENDLHLRNVGSQKCLDVAGNASANGTKIQISDCYKSKGQSWKGDVRATAPLKSVTTGKCLDLSAFTKSTDARLWDCKDAGSQKFLIKPSGHQGTDSLSYPDKAQFDKAKKGVAAAQAKAARELALLKARAAAVQKAVATTDAAEKAAYAIADERGAPRGRGLLVGQQKAQVTKGAAAALQAMVKAGETAEAATRASAGDSATIAQRALAQAAQSKAEFRREAAHAAELQAKASADAAKLHRDNAKKDKETAEAKLTEALKAEGEAKTAAAEARAERLAAEAEEKTAEAEKKKAAAKQAEAAEHRKTAETEATKAKDAKDKAEAAEGTASDKRDAAVKARDKARDLRDDAWDAEQKADAARAKADAKEAYAQAHESDSNAQEARAAADAAAGHADDAEAAATKARTAADAATQAAADADAAATRAEAAAKRARAHADGAQAAKLKADAAVRTATSAAADAIQAAKHAASEAKAAVELADEAEKEAKTARTHANEASKEAAKALVASAKAAGFAHVTAQAAADAGNAAAQVAKPANDAIQLGSPYVDTDSAAGLVVLTGQASKSIAEQQKAVAEAHAKNAQAEASAAKNLADQAKGDAKQAYVHAANAAGHAADARTYAKEALGYAADAATAASKAAASLARTVEYDRQATEDAEAADKAAGRAESHAADARDSADEAALDAEAARTAASEAEEAARDARAAANRADVAATEAEEAAKDALKYAEEAQEAAESAERKQANQQVSSGAGTGIGGVFYVADEDTVKVTDAQQKNDCVIEIGFEGCTVTFAVTFEVKVDFYLCTNPDVPATATGCPAGDTLYLGTQPFDGLKKDVTQYFSKLDLIKQTVVYQILKAALVQDFVDCWHGSVGGCAWAASNFIPGKAFAKIGDALHALNAAMHTGVGVTDALKALKALDGIDPATVAKIEGAVNAYEDVITACRVNSFPGATRVLMADGSRKAIRDVRVGDLLLAGDPLTGRSDVQPVTDTFRHPTTRLIDIALTDGALTSTAGHRFWVEGKGWTLVSDLRTGDRLRTPDDTLHAVTGLRDRSGLASREVFDLTVDALHTFYVTTEGTRPQDVLVHNCTDIVGDEGIEGAHTLRDHVNKTDAQMREKALASTRGIATRWLDEATAARAVDKAMREWIAQPRNAAKLETWRNKQAQRIGKGIGFDPRKDLLTFTWTLGDEGSLGFKWVRSGDDAAKSAAGNTVSISLKYVGKQHKPSKYVVYTAYLEG